MQTTKKKFKMPRMSAWVLVTAVLLAYVAIAAPQNLPVLVYKAVLITIAGVVGYRLDVGIFPYARPGDFKNNSAYPMMMLRRAIIVAAVILAFSLGV